MKIDKNAEDEYGDEFEDDNNNKKEEKEEE